MCVMLLERDDDDDDDGSQVMLPFFKVKVYFFILKLFLVEHSFLYDLTVTCHGPFGGTIFAE